MTAKFVISWISVFLGWYLCINNLHLNLKAQHPIPDINTCSIFNRILDPASQNGVLNWTYLSSTTWFYCQSCYTSAFVRALVYEECYTIMYILDLQSSLSQNSISKQPKYDLSISIFAKFQRYHGVVQSKRVTDEPLRLRTSSSLERTRLSSSDIRLSRTSTAAPFSLAAILFVLRVASARRAKAVVEYVVYEYTNF